MPPNSSRDSARSEDAKEWIPGQVSRFGLVWRIALAGFIGLGVWIGMVGVIATDAPQAEQPMRLLLLDPVIGVVSLILVAKYRRSHALLIAVVVTLLSLLSVSAAGATMWAACSLATRRKFREIAILAVVLIGTALLSPYVLGLSQVFAPGPWWFETLIAVLSTAVNLSIGYAVGSRRALVSAWVDRARTSEAEQRARVAAAQSAERTRIAREMHDVLAHRISLVALHAGALRYRPDLPTDERAASVDVIAGNAEQALADLRAVLGVLRDPSTVAVGTEVEPPQPDLPDVLRLISDARAAGERIELTDELDDEVPQPVGRAAYRIVQEALTNARKHSPGSTVRVTLSGRPESGLTVTVSNPRPVAAPAPLPTSGLGLLGVRERVDLLDGHLRHGPTPEGGYRLTAWLPWSA